MSDETAGPGTGYVDDGPSRFDILADHFGGVQYWFGAGVSAVGSALVVSSGMVSPRLLFTGGLATICAVAVYGVMADD